MFDDLPMKKKFSSYIGVVLGIFNSGGSENNLGVTPRANTILRPDIIERAWIAIRKDPEIQITLLLNNTRAYQTT